HEILAQRHVDLIRPEQLDNLGAVFEVGAGGITEAVTAAAIALLPDLFEFRRIFRSKAQLLPHPLVPQLRQRLGAFDAETMEIELFLILFFLKQLLSQFRSAIANGHELYAEDIEFPRFNAGEKVSDAQPPAFFLPRECESQPLARIG